ncbi:MAG TPA: hypothetical protein VNN07_10295, partial [Candidatus Tectomicrobia bacterium]|nr:hypothetical protein [Candidatus Tectomicrobia bacterium]
AGRFLDTPLAAASETSGGGRPSRAVQAAMDRLVAAAVRADAAGVSRQAWAPWLLYVRSHWLRMPPWLLAPHLARKAARLRPA